MSAEQRAAAAAALGQWTGVAREAEFVARRATQTRSLELLQAARKAGLGTSIVDEMRAEHERQGKLLRAAVLACTATLERVATQLAELQSIQQAANRILVTLLAPRAVGDTERLQLAAAADDTRAAIAEAAATTARLEVARSNAQAALTAATAAQNRHAARSELLLGLTARFAELGSQAAHAVELLANAGKELDATAMVYEAARLSALDLHRERLTPAPGTPLPPPSGTPLAGPAVHSNDGARR